MPALRQLCGRGTWRPESGAEMVLTGLQVSVGSTDRAALEAGGGGGGEGGGEGSTRAIQMLQREPDWSPIIGRKLIAVNIFIV